MNRVQLFVHFLKWVLFGACFSSACAENIDPTELSIDQLMQSQVTSATRTDQKFSDTAAAVYVITQNDIQRSGVTNIPDVLRMAPGVQVARIGAGKWAVTVRGFNGRFANKLLVLLDGRTVYSPTFAGVRWENLDLVLQDIDRIEVIRGSGASVWGQNAVNGVINIITKHTEDTQQGLVSVLAGNEETATVELRYGDQWGDNASYRVFGKFLRRDGLVDLQENNADDDLTQGRGGFRIDWNSSDGDQWMIEADGYVGKLNDDFLFPTDNPLGRARKNSEQNLGANVLSRWEHDFSVASKIKTQFFYEYFDLIDPEFGGETNHTFDFDFQHDIALSKDNSFNWGVGYQYVRSYFFEGLFSTVNPSKINLHLVTGFLQDKMAMFDDALQLTIGTKVQYYTLSKWDFQPSAKLLWKFHPEHRVWASFSRSIRSPSRGETAYGLKPIALSFPFPVNLVLLANSELDREELYSYEFGYRGWVGNHVSLDVAFFYNEYEDLVTTSVDLDGFASGQLSASFNNGGSAKTWGIEVTSEWRPIEPWRLQFSYSFLKAGSSQSNLSSKDPEHRFSFRSSYDVSSTIIVDAWVRYVSAFSSKQIFIDSSRSIDSYVSLDLRLAWKPIHSLELSIVGQNLNNNKHIEYQDDVFAYPKQLERSIFGKVQWSY